VVGSFLLLPLGAQIFSFSTALSRLGIHHILLRAQGGESFYCQVCQLVSNFVMAKYYETTMFASSSMLYRVKWESHPYHICVKQWMVELAIADGEHIT
jgi:hypothetical protein